MQAEVENKNWNDSVQSINNNEFRLQTNVAAMFPNGRIEDLTLGLPNIKHVKAASRKDLPPVMWRVYSRTSAGDNSEAAFLAHALSERVAHKYGLKAGSRSRRMEDFDQTEMRDMLSNHLGWHKKSGGFESRFISVTSSPLFALQLAIQKHARMKREERLAKRAAEEAARKKMKKADKKSEIDWEQDGDEDSDIEIPKKKARVNVPEGDIFISIIDTSKLPKGTAIYKANVMLAAYENGKPLTQNPEFFVAEYLVWETLKVDSCHVAFDTLLENGLLTLFDDFKQSPNNLQTQVQNLRSSLFDWGPLQNKKRTHIPHRRFSIAMRLAASFADKWQLPMFVAFLSLLRRWHTDDSIILRAVQAIEDGFIRLPAPLDLPQKRPSRNSVVPEIAGYEQLMWTLCQYLKGEKGVPGEDEPSRGLPVGNLMARGKGMRGTLPYFVAPILKKRPPKVKFEPKLEVKHEVKGENNVDTEAKEEGQNTSSSSVATETPDSSKKRKSPEVNDQDKQAGGSPQEVDQVPVLKKVKMTNDASSAQPQAEPASAGSDATQPAPPYNKSMGEVAAGNAGGLASDQKIGQTTAENENHVSFEDCRGNDETVTSEWEGFDSDEDAEVGNQPSEAEDNAALREGFAVGYDIQPANEGKLGTEKEDGKEEKADQKQSDADHV